MRRLLPYHRNVGKRLVKAAKVYLRDTGLLHHLLNLSTLAELENHPARGASWETFVTEDVIRREKLAYPQSQFFFWRTAAGAEIDLVIERGPQRFGFELKAGSGEKMVYAHKLAAALADVGVSSGWVLDQSAGITPLLPNVACRGFAGAWLAAGSVLHAHQTRQAVSPFQTSTAAIMFTDMGGCGALNSVPQGRQRIARRFIAGWGGAWKKVPPGRQKV